MGITAMDYTNTKDWKWIAGEEHTQRQQAEQQLAALQDAYRTAQRELSKANAYNNYLESKNQELEHNTQALQAHCTALSDRLRVATDMLKKAKQILKIRKLELEQAVASNANLQHQMHKLQGTIQAYVDETLEARLQHEQTKDKLAATLEKLRNAENHDLFDQFAVQRIELDLKTKLLDEQTQRHDAAKQLLDQALEELALLRQIQTATLMPLENIDADGNETSTETIHTYFAHTALYAPEDTEFRANDKFMQQLQYIGQQFTED